MLRAPYPRKARQLDIQLLEAHNINIGSIGKGI